MEEKNKDQEKPLPQEIVMQMVMGAWISKSISDITRMDIPDIVKEHGPKTALELVETYGVNAHPESLERVLRACASIGIFTEDSEGSFGPTALSETLTTSFHGSIKKITEMFGASWWKVWGNFENAIKTGEMQVKAVFGMDYWDYCKNNPKEMEDFGEAMKSNSLNSMRGILENCDFSGVKKVVDVGGGFGHLAVELLKKYKDMQAIVLDLPELIPIARKSLVLEESVACRLEYIGGDMFKEVPVADVYIMKHIIHDWDDALCIQLLKNCHKNMDGDGRIICVDAVLPPMGDTRGVASKFLDLNMMVFNPGKERTHNQWENLYDTAGFKLHSITSFQDNFGTSMLEGKKHAKK